MQLQNCIYGFILKRERKLLTDNTHTFDLFLFRGERVRVVRRLVIRGWLWRNRSTGLARSGRNDAAHMGALMGNADDCFIGRTIWILMTILTGFGSSRASSGGQSGDVASCNLHSATWFTTGAYSSRWIGREESRSNVTLQGFVPSLFFRFWRKQANQERIAVTTRADWGRCCLYSPRRRCKFYANSLALTFYVSKHLTFSSC